jgi:pyridoxal phosphate enzyme (YggS family)
MQKILDNYQQIKLCVPSDITLTVVTKKHEMDNILPLIQIGHYDFAENYVKEAQEKWVHVLQNNKNIKLKLIGKLQSNKIQDALMTFHEIHSVHSIELAHKISKEIKIHTRTKIFYAQVNIGNEEQKSGIKPEEIIRFFEESPLKISGLMCIPPVGFEPSSYFLLMQNLRKKVESQFNTNLKLSMGMSSDFQKAIALGSNEIRIGSAILGERTMQLV